MKIWVDADACPNGIKEILFRASIRTSTDLILVANAFLTTPPSKFISTICVNQGFDVADKYIVQNLAKNDLVITADIPLAYEVVEADGIALNPRGELYTVDNIKQRLGLRDIKEQLRGIGVNTGGPAAFSIKEKTAFANALDKILAKACK